MISPMAAIPPDVGVMFQHGIRYDWANGTHSVIDVQAAGVLKLPTGRLIAQDPGWGTHPAVEPFTVGVEPGHYPVTLSISHWDQSPTSGIPSPMRLVNAVKLTVRDEPAVFWDLALQPGQELASLADGQFFGFGVDSGTGCFMDASARDQLDRLVTDQDLWKEATGDIGARGFSDISTDDPDLNIIVFECGMGDGSYPTWIGRATGGATVCFVADLELLQHSLGPAGG
jgi:Protein of unknown function (DUF4241)